MERINLEELDMEKTFFHFTRAKYLEGEEGIIKKGLVSNLEYRENAVGDDKNNPAIYFAIGADGVLKLIDVWIRGEYNRIAGKNGKPPGNIGIDTEIMQKTFERIYDDFKSRKYLQIEGLIQGKDPTTSDYDIEGEDFKKKNALNKELNMIEVFKWMYGSYSIFDSNVMDNWNMNTHIGEKVITPDKLKMIQASNGRTDALSVISEIYEKFRSNTVDELIQLDDFMEYVQEKIKQEEKERSIKLGKETLEEQKNTQEKIAEEDFSIRIQREIQNEIGVENYDD